MVSWHQILSEAWNLAWPPEARRSSWRGLKDFVQALLGDGWDGMGWMGWKSWWKTPGFWRKN